MQILLVCLATIVWLAIWTYCAVCIAQRPKLEKKIDGLGNLFPAFAVATCVPLFFALPLPTGTTPTVIVRAIHYSGIVLLFAFLLFGSFCQLAVWHQMKRPSASLESLASIYRNWWVAVRVIPAPSAIFILASGLRLSYESSLGFISSGWMFWLATGFAFFFVDGLTFYLPEICYQHKAVHESLARHQTVGEYCAKYRNRFSEMMLLIHAISFPFIFALGCAKSPVLWKPDFISNFLIGIIPGTTPLARLGQVALLIAIVGLFLFVLRLPKLLVYRRFLNSKP